MTSTLAELVETIGSSLHAYLAAARVWTFPGGEALKLALAAHGSTYASAGNLNSSTGAPLALARMPADAVYAVLEMGMNRAGEIGPNSRVARPHGAIVTTVEPVHLQFFPSVEAIAEFKVNGVQMFFPTAK